MPVMVQAQEGQISPDAFLDRATGNTLTFELYPNGGIVGVEQFLSRSRTVWATPEGTCTYGKIELRGSQICFIYEDLPNPEHCWVPYAFEDKLVVVSSATSIQQVTQITQQPVVCEDAAIS
jgi:hypothetical protein